MKRLISNLLVFSIAVLLPSATFAEGRDDNRTDIPESRLLATYHGWERIIPTHVKLQYAGGMGLLSAGVGWDYGSKNRWETDVMVGFLPKTYSDRTHLTFTLRQNYIPWSMNISARFAVEPLSYGIYANLISGERFWIKEPERYPCDKGYYKFSSRLRFHAYVGQRLTLLTGDASTLQALSLYYEFSINDLMFVSKFNNRTLKLSDIVHFSIGVKAQLFGD